MKCCFISNKSKAASVLCKPIRAKLWPISEQRENWNSLSDCHLHISKYHLVHRRPNTRFYGACRTYTNFFYLILILGQFRIIWRKRQAALHSALFNYTPLRVRRGSIRVQLGSIRVWRGSIRVRRGSVRVRHGTDKNKQLTIIKPTQTGINRNKLTFCTIKSLEP